MLLDLFWLIMYLFNFILNCILWIYFKEWTISSLNEGGVLVYNKKKLYRKHFIFLYIVITCVTSSVCFLIGIRTPNYWATIFTTTPQNLQILYKINNHENVQPNQAFSNKTTIDNDIWRWDTKKRAKETNIFGL